MTKFFVPAWFSLLCDIDENPSTAAELSFKRKEHYPNLCVYVIALEKVGLIQRTADKKKKIITTTELGKEFANIIKKAKLQSYRTRSD